MVTMVNRTRNAVVAGQFYPGAESPLRKQIEESFLSTRGPGKLPTITEKTPRILGLVVPHAGYVYSGAIASYSYSTLASHGFAKTFIILGPNHTGMGSGVSVMTEGSWKTPLGTVAVNNSLGKMLQTGIIDSDERAHAYEHSIEVQLPFLQYLAKGRSFDFVPICMMMQDNDTALEVGGILAATVRKMKQTVTIIASSDFSHAGFNYQSMPPEGMRVDKYAERQDRLAIDKILAMDPAGLVQTVEDHEITMCGYGPVAAMLTAAKTLGATKAELLKYGTSYDVHPDSSCVGYAAIAVS
jgi:AmmeMemoRadiSam system protein B